MDGLGIQTTVQDACHDVEQVNKQRGKMVHACLRPVEGTLNVYLLVTIHEGPLHWPGNDVHSFLSVFVLSCTALLKILSRIQDIIRERSSLNRVLVECTHRKVTIVCLQIIKSP